MAPEQTGGGLPAVPRRSSEQGSSSCGGEAKRKCHSDFGGTPKRARLSAKREQSEWGTEQQPQLRSQSTASSVLHACLQWHRPSSPGPGPCAPAGIEQRTPLSGDNDAARAACSCVAWSGPHDSAPVPLTGCQQCPRCPVGTQQQPLWRLHHSCSWQQQVQPGVQRQQDQPHYQQQQQHHHHHHHHHHQPWRNPSARHTPRSLHLLAQQRRLRLTLQLCQPACIASSCGGSGPTPLVIHPARNAPWPAARAPSPLWPRWGNTASSHQLLLLRHTLPPPPPPLPQQQGHLAVNRWQDLRTAGTCLRATLAADLPASRPLTAPHTGVAAVLSGDHTRSLQRWPATSAAAVSPYVCAALPSTPDAAREVIFFASKSLGVCLGTTARLAIHIWDRVRGTVQVAVSAQLPVDTAGCAGCVGGGAVAALRPSATAVAALERTYAMAALWLATKLQERRHRVPGVHLMCALGRTLPGCLAEAEARVLRWCDWAPYAGFLPP